MKPRALVMEPDLSGHRWRYVQWTIEALVEAGYECVLWTEARNRDHPLVQAYEVCRSSVTVISHREAHPRLPVPYAALQAAKADFAFYATFASVYREAVQSQRVDLVVVPYGDYIINAAGMLGSPFGATGWICIVMRQSFHLRAMGVKAPRRMLAEFVKKRLFYRALRRANLSAVLTIDPTLSIWHATSPRTGHCPPVHYLADPFPEVEYVDQWEARARLGLGYGRCILVYGAISDRKGIKELLYACMKRNEHPHIVIAGEQSADVRAFIASIGGSLFSRITVFDHFISPEMEADLFCACDVVWVGYKGHYGMSGVLVQAYRYERTVIATREGLIGWFTKQDRLGPLLRNLSACSINSAIDEAFALDVERREPEADKLLARNTVDNFKKVVQSALVETGNGNGLAHTARDHHGESDLWRAGRGPAAGLSPTSGNGHFSRNHVP